MSGWATTVESARRIGKVFCRRLNNSLQKGEVFDRYPVLSGPGGKFTRNFFCTCCQCRRNATRAAAHGPWGTIIISTATTVLVCGYVQRNGAGVYISLRVIDLETAVGYEDTAVLGTMKQRILSYRAPPCHKRPVIALELPCCTVYIVTYHDSLPSHPNPTRVAN